VRARLLLPFLAFLIAALLVAGPAAARILPQQGIAGVKLGMIRAKVIELKGEPDAEKVIRNEIIGPQRVMRYGGTKFSFGGASANATVVGIRTVDRRERTPKGVGVGSTEAEVKAGVGGVICRTEFGFSHCMKGLARAGNRVTDFALDGPGGKVVAVTVGFVID
jgi:hypothetical protein